MDDFLQKLGINHAIEQTSVVNLMNCKKLKADRAKAKQSTCIAPCMVQTTLKRSGMDHTGFNLQRTPCLPLAVGFTIVTLKQCEV